MTDTPAAPTRQCAGGCKGTRTTLYIQSGNGINGMTTSYVALCRDHARSRRALGYRLSPVRKSRGTY